jgi:antitoxin (DNA-binding transcriptional repressor) of toxin-antitoxin stability system
MTASEAARNFSAVLDAIENGETIVVTRAGRRIAAMAPAPTETGAALNEVLERWAGSNLFDDTFLARLDDTLTATDPDADVDPWND